MIKDQVRLRLEEREELLSPFAARSRLSLGRLRPEEPSPLRTAFQRDRDRIIHSKSFRRLKHKTQVFIAPPGDYFVTRLTHTLEVSQIARTIARALNLNEDLTEAIALGHDLGHTPFGHVGEEVLAAIHPGGFRHNEQSLRTVDLLEKDGHGLNLTWEVREGILKHSKPREGILSEGWGTAGTLEGQICKVADSVAYINHDLADALSAGVITEDGLPKKALKVLGHNHSERINTLVCDIVESSWAASGSGDSGGTPSITLSPRVLEAADNLREFLFQEVYNSRSALEEATKAKKVLRLLYYYFADHEEEIPPQYRLRGEPVERQVVDYIASMTDQYALKVLQQLRLPVFS